LVAIKLIRGWVMRLFDKASDRGGDRWGVFKWSGL